MSGAHPSHIGDFQVMGVLGRGGMGVVYRVRDPETDEVVALKIVSPEHLGRSEAVLRFKREFRAMQRVQHPNVVRVFASGTYEGCPYFTMEVIEGSDVRAWLDDGDPIVKTGKNPPPQGVLEVEQRQRLNDPARVRRVSEAIIQVALALGAIHRHRIVHRDLKPDNILVSQAGIVKLMDFGIAKQITTSNDHSSGGVVVGTFKYLSPEQAMGRQVDGRADLYCLGIVLYEALAGRHPFYSDTSVGYAYHHARKTPPPVASFNPEVDPGLAAICERLIKKDPNERFPTAEDVVAAIRKTVDGLDEQSSRFKDEKTGAGRADVFPPAHIGRARETGALLTVCEQLHGGQGRVVVVKGPARIGKTRLMREAAAQARALDVEFVVGRCDPAAGGPYHPFIEILDKIVDDHAETHRDEVHNLLGKDAPVLARYLPSIERLGSAAHARPVAALEPQAERLRFMTAVSNFLGRVSLVKRRVLVIEDLENADELSLELIRHLAESVASAEPRAPSPRGGPVALIVTLNLTAERAKKVRTLVDELQAKASRGILLSALDEEGVREMVVTMTGGGDVGSELAAALHAETSGVPGLVEERIRALAEAGLLRRQGTEWVLLKRPPRAKKPTTVDVSPLPDLGELDSLEPSDAVQLRAATRADLRLVALDAVNQEERRLKKISPIARDVAQRAAVIGERFSGLLVNRVALRPEGELLDALNDLLDAKVFAEAGEGEGYRFVSTEQRDVLLRTIDAETLKLHHQAVVRALEEEARQLKRPIDPEVLARHHELGGEPLKALGKLMIAARRALEAGAPQTAAERVREAQELFMRECAPQADDADVARRDADLVLLRLDVLAAFGEHKECVSLATRRMPKMRSVLDARMVAEVLLRLASSEHAIGDLDDAYTHALEALSITERANSPSLRCRVKSLCGVIYAQRGQFDHAERYWKDAVDLARTIGDENEEERARSALAGRRLDVGDLAAAEHDFRLLLEGARSRGERVRVASYVNALAVIAHERGQYDDAERSYRESIHLAKPTGNRRIIGIGLLNLASVFRDRRRFDDALFFARRAWRMLESIDDREIVAAVRIVESQIELELGKADEALRLAEDAFDVAERTGSVSKLAEASICRGLANLKLRDVEGGRADIERGVQAARELDLNRILLVGMAALVEVHAREGERGEALLVLNDARRRARDTGFVRSLERLDRLDIDLKLAVA
jgi:predicted ATPase/tRNA A-37 threonylcarbamoyl transferase component Bud32